MPLVPRSNNFRIDWRARIKNAEPMTALPPLRYAPWHEPRLARKPGTLPLDPAAWIERCPRFEVEMAYRRQLIAERRAVVFAETPASAPAQAELLTALEAYLGEGAASADPAPVVRAGLMVQEDLCILEQAKAGAEYLLTAAILCFPSRWSLAEKIGHPLTAIHGPVPDYTDDLAKRVNRLFEAVRPEQPLWRANWTVHSSDELHQPSGDFRASEDPAAPLYVRVERQTFMRLPQTRAVVFGIRTFLDPLEALSPAQARSLHAAISRFGPDEIDYRGGQALHEAILEGLARRRA